MNFAKRHNTQKSMAENPKEIFAKPTQPIPNKYYPDCQACWGFFSLAETSVHKRALCCLTEA